MEIVPASVGRTSRVWDEQHLDLEGAARQLAAAETAGFTEAVTETAHAFATAWAGFTRQLGTDAENRADSLRRVIGTYLTSDETARLLLSPDAELTASRLELR